MSDPDGDKLKFQWFEGDTLVAGGWARTSKSGGEVDLPCRWVKLSLGVHKMVLVVTDGKSDPVTSECTIEVVDTTAPVLFPYARPAILKPNGEMKTVVVKANAWDNSRSPLDYAVNVTSYPENPSATPEYPDWVIDRIDARTGRIYMKLRADAVGGEPRTYRIDITATDESGNSGTGKAMVYVPKPRVKGKK